MSLMGHKELTEIMRYLLYLSIFFSLITGPLIIYIEPQSEVEFENKRVYRVKSINGIKLGQIFDIAINRYRQIKKVYTSQNSEIYFENPVSIKKIKYIPSYYLYIYALFYFSISTTVIAGCFILLDIISSNNLFHIIILHITFIKILTLIFIISVLLGIIYPAKTVDISDIFNRIPEISEIKNHNKKPTYRAFLIFKNNFGKIFFIATITGVLLVTQPIIIIINGYLLGSVISGLKPDTLKLIIPHGIFEIPGIILLLSASLKFYVSLFRKSYSIKTALKYFLIISTVSASILLSASILELFFTPAVYLISW